MIKLLLTIFYVASMVILLIVLYKALLKRMNRGNVSSDNYCELTSVEIRPSYGIIDFCFSCKEKRMIDFEIVTLNFEPIITIVSKEFEKGQHILKFDSTQLGNGDYYYQLRTNNQRIFKKITIDNPKLDN
jgi:hypothetical protein